MDHVEKSRKTCWNGLGLGRFTAASEIERLDAKQKGALKSCFTRESVSCPCLNGNPNKAAGLDMIKATVSRQNPASVVDKHAVLSSITRQVKEIGQGFGR